MNEHNNNQTIIKCNLNNNLKINKHMTKKIISVDMTKVDENMLSFLSELESKGYVKDGYLEYEDSDKGEILNIFSKYGFEFTE